MNEQEQIHFDRIASAISYIAEHYQDQPNLDKVAEELNLSPFHFQRLFTEWAGVSPKKFLQYISIEHAKELLKTNQLTLSQTAYELGLSGTSRLHDLFVTIEGMTPAEFRHGGRDLVINFSFADSLFGEILVASTHKGICYLGFTDSIKSGLDDLKQRFPNASYHQKVDLLQQHALHVFSQDWSKLDEVKLHLKGTAFQLKVWEALIKIPRGSLATYAQVAEYIARPKASRAVGTAIGDNPVAYLIPCHRVIQSTGKFGQYHWGPSRKTAIIGWEMVRRSNEK